MKLNKSYKDTIKIIGLLLFNSYLLLEMYQIKYIIEEKILILIYFNSIFILVKLYLTGEKKE